MQHVWNHLGIKDERTMTNPARMETAEELFKLKKEIRKIVDSLAKQQVECDIMRRCHDQGLHFENTDQLREYWLPEKDLTKDKIANMQKILSSNDKKKDSSNFEARILSIFHGPNARLVGKNLVGYTAHFYNYHLGCFRKKINPDWKSRTDEQHVMSVMQTCPRNLPMEFKKKAPKDVSNDLGWCVQFKGTPICCAYALLGDEFARYWHGIPESWNGVICVKWGPSFQEPAKPKPDLVGVKEAFSKFFHEMGADSKPAAADSASLPALRDDSRTMSGVTPATIATVAAPQMVTHDRPTTDVAADSATLPTPPGEAPGNDSRTISDVTTATITVETPKMVNAAATQEELTTDGAMQGAVETPKKDGAATMDVAMLHTPAKRPIEDCTMDKQIEAKPKKTKKDSAITKETKNAVKKALRTDQAFLNVMWKKAEVKLAILSHRPQLIITSLLSNISITSAFWNVVPTESPC